MKALCWHGTNDVRIDTVPYPKILHPRDAIIKVSSPRNMVQFLVSIFAVIQHS